MQSTFSAAWQMPHWLRWCRSARSMMVCVWCSWLSLLGLMVDVEGELGRGRCLTDVASWAAVACFVGGEITCRVEWSPRFPGVVS